MRIFKKMAALLMVGAVSAMVGIYYGNKYQILGTDDTTYTNNIQVSLPQKTTINTDTILEFHYNYSDGLSSTQYTMPPEYMSGYTKEELEKAYSSWQMDSFSENRVVFIKNFETESTQHYVLKDYNGYVGVFYKKTGMLKELTSTPVASLSAADAEKYKKGFYVDGDENLVKCLEDLET